MTNHSSVQLICSNFTLNSEDNVSTWSYFFKVTELDMLLYGKSPFNRTVYANISATAHFIVQQVNHVTDSHTDLNCETRKSSTYLSKIPSTLYTVNSGLMNLRDSKLTISRQTKIYTSERKFPKLIP